MSELPLLLIVGLGALAIFLFGYLGKKVKLPQLLFYVFAGYLISQLIDINESFDIIAKLGIVVLFFFIGLEFNIIRVLEISKKIWKIGFIDLFLNFVLFFVILLAIGFSFQYSFGIASIVYASSSSIIIKLIVDNHRIANPETEFLLGISVFEDIVSPILLAFAAAITSGSNFSFVTISFIFGKIILVIGLGIILAILSRKYLIKIIDHYLNDEIIIVLILGFVIFLAGFTEYLHLSEALGAFIAGLIVAESDKKFEIAQITIPIRDFFVTFFFFYFGAQLSKSSFAGYFWMLMVIIFFSIFTKFITGYYGGRIYGLSKRRSFISGLQLIPRGEFSIVLAKYLPNALLPIANIYIFITALIGTILGYFSYKISEKLYKK